MNSVTALTPHQAITQLRSSCAAEYQLFLADQNVARLTKKLTEFNDLAMAQLWQNCAMGTHLALIAVGGYGRAELFPYSDIDILVLLPDDSTQDSQADNEKVARFITQCWDSGLEIGSAVRTLGECISEAEQDITVRTSLLEARLICGSRSLFKSFQTAYSATLDPKAFFQAKLLEQTQRHQKYQGTPYALEPNCKESPGGLRDLQAILWVSKAAQLGNSFNDLYQKNLITERELTELKRNKRFLATLRANLHLLAKRHQDVLAFDLQAGLAKSMGIEESSARQASEAIMRRYYWVAKAVTQLNTILLQNIEALLFPQESRTIHPIAGEENGNFIERQGLLDIQDPDLYQKHPEQILRTFLVLTQTPAVNGLSAAPQARSSAA